MIGIIAAMSEEAAYLKQHMTDVSVFSTANQTFHCGNINGVPVTLLECGIGKVNAAIGTTLMIERFKPTYIINTGTAGGLHEALNIGDIVISIEVRHHDVDLTVFGYEHGQLPQLPAAFSPSQALIDAAEKAAIKLNMHVTKGLIISGDSFMSCDSKNATIRDKFSSASAVEMEAAAIGQVCHQFDIPFVVIRAISDVAGKTAAVSFKAFLEMAARQSAELILYTLKELSDASIPC